MTVYSHAKLRESGVLPWCASAKGTRTPRSWTKLIAQSRVSPDMQAHVGWPERESNNELLVHWCNAMVKVRVAAFRRQVAQLHEACAGLGEPSIGECSVGHDMAMHIHTKVVCK